MFREPFHAWITHKASLLKGEVRREPKVIKSHGIPFFSSCFSRWNQQFNRNGWEEINERRPAKNRKQRHNRIRWKSSPSKSKHVESCGEAKSSHVGHVGRLRNRFWTCERSLVLDLWKLDKSISLALSESFIAHIALHHTLEGIIFISPLCTSSGNELQFAACLFSPAGRNSWKPIR